MPGSDAMQSLSLSSSILLPSGYHIPRLGFGVYQNYTARESCLHAFKAGYRHVDGAQAYRNEVDVGKAVRESGLRRDEVFITTKCVSRSHGYESTLKGVNESLERFGFDYIDLFLIHDPYSGSEKRLATYKALKECQAAGKIRSVGVSNFNIHHIEEIKAAGMDLPVINQIELHPFCQQKAVVEYCQKHGIVLEAYCPIIRGEMDHPVFHEIAKKHSRDEAQILLRWSLQKGYVPLVKSATESRIYSNTRLYDFELDEDDMARLNALDKGRDGHVAWNPLDAP